LSWTNFYDFYIEVSEINNTEKCVNLECRTFYFVKKLGEQTATGAVITTKAVGLKLSVFV
jgi:hypothetical protein